MVNKLMKQIVIFLSLFLILLTTGNKVLFAEEVIYVAGVPDEYPLEYYDEKTDKYKGMVYDLLDTAASKSGLKIEYIEISKQDQRLSLAKNLQVDLVCAIGLSEEELQVAGLTKGATILTYTDETVKKDIYFAYTSTMPSSALQKLESAFEKIDKNELLDSFLKTATSGFESKSSFLLFHYVLPALLILSLMFLLLIPYLLKKKKNELNEATYLDEKTGQYNYEKWKLKYAENVRDENCQNYAVVYMNTGIENISKVYGITEAIDAVSIIHKICMNHVDSKFEGVARYNEFYFLFFMQNASKDELKKRVQAIHRELVNEFRTRNKQYFLNLKTGIYQIVKPDTKLNDVLQYSKIAMEYAFNNYLPIAFYDEEVEKETITGYLMEHEAVHGLLNKEFLMYLQPIQNLKTGEICGAEALVRWLNPVRGLLKPKDFMFVMKRKKLTGRMNMEIFLQGCQLLKSEASKNHFPCLLFNFSVENFSDELFVDELVALAHHYGINTQQIIIQLNQLVEISESDRFIVTIKKLRENGFDVCLSGLELDKVFFEYLKQDVNYIKLRRELLQNVKNPKGLKVLETIIDLSHDLNLKVLCVGVEEEEQASILKDLKCELATGYYFCYPVNREVFSSILENKTTEHIRSEFLEEQ